MFGMGFSEILIILVIGIIFLGPEKLPEAMVKIAKFFNMFKKTINEAKESIDQELRIEELKKEAMEYKRKLHETTSSVKSSIYMDEFEQIKNSTSDFGETLKKSIEEPIKETKELTNLKEKPKKEEEPDIPKTSKDTKSNKEESKNV